MSDVNLAAVPVVPLPPPSSTLPAHLQDNNRSGGYPTELFDEKELERHSDLVCSLCTSVCRHVVSCSTD